MEKCVICNKEDGGLKCTLCNRNIGFDCATTSEGKTYCIDHVPMKPIEPAKKTQKYSLSVLMKAIWTVLFLDVGAGIIFYIMQRYASNFPVLPAEPVMALVQLFQTTGLLLLEGLTAMLVLLVVIYLILRRIKK